MIDISFLRFRLLRSALLLLLISTNNIWGADEPLIGTWKLTSQVINGQKINTDDLTLRIFKSGDGLEFAYSVPINNVHFVSARFTSVHLDGSSSDVKDAQGNKVGTVKITKAGSSEYKALIEGPNRPTASAKMTISADGKTLTSESTANVPGKGATTTLQKFSRY